MDSVESERYPRHLSLIIQHLSTASRAIPSSISRTSRCMNSQRYGVSRSSCIPDGSSVDAEARMTCCRQQLPQSVGREVGYKSGHSPERSSHPVFSFGLFLEVPKRYWQESYCWFLPVVVSLPCSRMATSTHVTSSHSFMSSACMHARNKLQRLGDRHCHSHVAAGTSRMETLETRFSCIITADSLKVSHIDTAPTSNHSECFRHECRALLK